MENNNFKPFPFEQLKQKKEPEKTAVAIDYDPGASEVNQINRIKLMLSAAEKNMNK